MKWTTPIEGKAGEAWIKSFTAHKTKTNNMKV